MGEFIDGLRSIAVDATSPRSAVRVSMSTADGIQVALSPDLLPEHDEVSLAEELEEAVILAREKYSHELSRLLAIVRAAEDPQPAAEAVRINRHTTLIADVEVEAQSPRGGVKVVMYGDGDISISITPAYLVRVGNQDAIAFEIASALNAASEEFRIRKRTIHREVYGSENRR